MRYDDVGAIWYYVLALLGAAGFGMMGFAVFVEARTGVGAILGLLLFAAGSYGGAMSFKVLLDDPIIAAENSTNDDPPRTNQNSSNPGGNETTQRRA